MREAGDGWTGDAGPKGRVLKGKGKASQGGRYEGLSHSAANEEVCSKGTDSLGLLEGRET